MGLFNIKKALAGLKTQYTKARQAIDQKAEKDLAKARTRNEKQIIKLRQRREMAQLNTELAEAKKATQEVEASAKRAKRESGGSGIVGGIKAGYRGLEKFYNRPEGRSPAARKRKAAPKKTTPKKRTR